MLQRIQQNYMNVKKINGKSYITIYEASQQLNRSMTTIYNLVNSNKLVSLRLSKKCTLIDTESISSVLSERSPTINDSEIIAKYKEKVSLRQLSILYRIDYRKLKIILSNNGIDLRHNTEYKIKNNIIDDTIFDTIDNEFSAYFLGLLWADGYNSIEKKNITISLQETDKDILEKISNEIFHKEILYNKKTKGNRKNQTLLYFYSPKISSLLNEYGLNTQRNFHGGLPKCSIPKNIFHHFLRGLWDGDGSIFIVKHSNDYASSFIGSSFICKEIQQKIKEYYDFDICLTPDKNYSDPIGMARLHVHGNKKTKKLLDIFYQNSTIYMNRKYEKYKSLCNV